MSLFRPPCLILCATLLALASSVTAQEDVAARERAAFASLQDASQAYDDGEYEIALVELDAAWALFPAPAILYNRGRTLEALGRREEAIRAYEEYLERDETPHNPDGVRGAIVRLRGEVAAMDAESAPSETQTDVAPERPLEEEVHEELVDLPIVERSSAVPAWVLVGSGVAMAAAGTLFWVLAKSDNDAAQGMSHQESFPEFATQERAENRALVGNILVPLAGALLAGGVVWLIVRAMGNDDVAVRPSGFGVRF